MRGSLLMALSPGLAQLTQPAAPPLRVPELVIGGVLALLGVRSLIKWLGTRFEGDTPRDQLLFVLHAAARVGLWFAFAGFFFGFALVEEVGSLVKWYVFVPIGLAGVQLMTAVFLARSPRQSGPAGSGPSEDGGSGESLGHGGDETVTGPAGAGEARGDGRPRPPTAGGSRGGERPAPGEPGP